MIPDTKSKFDNIDLSFNIDSGRGRVDVFKMHDKFSENFEKIVNVLPGYGNEINTDPLKNNHEK